MDTPTPPTQSSLQTLSVQDFQRLEAKLDRIEAMLSGPHQMLQDAPHLAATVTNIADEVVSKLAEKQIDVDERARHLLKLIEHLTDPKTLSSLDHFLAHPEQLSQILGALEQVPGTFAMAVNIVDDLIAHLQRKDIDVEQILKQTMQSTKILVEFMQSDQFRALMESSVFAPEIVEIIAKMAHALRHTHDEEPGEVGLFGALRQAKDPSVRRTLDFGLRFAKRFGGLLVAPARALTGK